MYLNNYIWHVLEVICSMVPGKNSSLKALICLLLGILLNYFLYAKVGGQEFWLENEVRRVSIPETKNCKKVIGLYPFYTLGCQGNVLASYSFSGDLCKVRMH